MTTSQWKKGYDAKYRNIFYFKGIKIGMQFYWKTTKEVKEKDESFLIVCKAQTLFEMHFQRALLDARSRTLFKMYRQRELIH